MLYVCAYMGVCTRGLIGHVVTQLVEALRYKTEGRGKIFHSHNPSSRTMDQGLTELLREMSARNISRGVKTAGARADNLTTFMCRLS